MLVLPLECGSSWEEGEQRLGKEGEVGVEKYLAPHETVSDVSWNWNMVEWECGQLTNAHTLLYVSWNWDTVEWECGQLTNAHTLLYVSWNWDTVEWAVQ